DAIRGGVFDDPAWIARWDVVFARRYMEAMDGWSQKQPVSDPWRLAFTAAQSEALEPAKHALLAMNAHINYDLPQAILEVVNDAEFEQGTLPPDRHVDNYRLQDVLFSNVAKEGAEFEQAQGGGTLLARVETPFEHPATKKFMGAHAMRLGRTRRVSLSREPEASRPTWPSCSRNSRTCAQRRCRSSPPRSRWCSS